MAKRNPWCLSRTGRRIEYNKFHEESAALNELATIIHPSDVCVGLSTKYRFTGFTKVPWSVLSHTVIGTALILQRYFPDSTFQDLTERRNDFGYAVAEAYFTHDFSEYLVPDFNNLLKPSLQMVTGDVSSDAETVVTWRNWENQVQRQILLSLYYPSLVSCAIDGPVRNTAHEYDMRMARLEAECLHCFSPVDIAEGSFAEVDFQTRTLFADYIYRVQTANRRLYIPHYSSADPGRLQYRDGFTELQASDVGCFLDGGQFPLREGSLRVTLPPFDLWRDPYDIDGLYGPWHIHHPQFLFWAFLRLFVPGSWFWGSDDGKPIGRFLSQFDDCSPSLRNLCTLGL